MNQPLRPSLCRLAQHGLQIREVLRRTGAMTEKPTRLLPHAIVPERRSRMCHFNSAMARTMRSPSRNQRIPAAAGVQRPPPPPPQRESQNHLPLNQPKSANSRLNQLCLLSTPSLPAHADRLSQPVSVKWVLNLLCLLSRPAGWTRRAGDGWGADPGGGKTGWMQMQNSGPPQVLVSPNL